MTVTPWLSNNFCTDSTFTLSPEEQRKDSVASGGMEKALGATVGPRHETGRVGLW